MKLAIICLFSVVLCLAAELSSAQYTSRNDNYRLGRNTNSRNDNYRLGRNTNSRNHNYRLDLNGLNYRSNDGRHNANLNYRNLRYNYRATNQWNTGINHDFGNRQTNLNANYKRNHNFRAGYNWQNRQVNVGYRWDFGKRRRSIDTHDEMLEFLKMESEPSVFLTKLRTAVDMFVKTNQYTVPQLEVLSVSVPVNQITNVTVAEELVCVVKKLQIILPKSLGNFTAKIIKFLGPSYNIEDLDDFFSVDPVPKFETEDDDGIEDACEVPEVPVSSELIDGGKLFAMKKFVASLITVAMEYQQMLEE